MISDKSLEKFRAIYRQELGKDISVAEARVQAEKLVRLMAIARRGCAKPPQSMRDEQIEAVKKQIIGKLERNPNWHRE